MSTCACFLTCSGGYMCKDEIRENRPFVSPHCQPLLRQNAFMSCCAFPLWGGGEKSASLAPAAEIKKCCNYSVCSELRNF